MATNFGFHTFHAEEGWIVVSMRHRAPYLGMTFRTKKAATAYLQAELAHDVGDPADCEFCQIVKQSAPPAASSTELSWEARQKEKRHNAAVKAAATRKRYAASAALRAAAEAL